MKKKLFVLLTAVMFIIPLVLYAVPQGNIKVKKIGTTKKAAVYNHQTHAAKGITSCKQCHHKGTVNDSCSKCHSGTAGKNALHKNCKDCHVKMNAGPKSCTACHKN